MDEKLNYAQTDRSYAPVRALLLSPMCFIAQAFATCKQVWLSSLAMGSSFAVEVGFRFAFIWASHIILLLPAVWRWVRQHAQQIPADSDVNVDRCARPSRDALSGRNPKSLAIDGTCR